MITPIDAYVLAFWSGPKKFCRKCQTPKPMALFRQHRLHRDGLNSHCTPCAQTAEAKHFADNPDKLARKRANTREYNKSHPKDRSAYHKARREAFTPEQLERERQMGRRNRQAKPEHYKQIRKQWVKNNPDKVKAKAKKYQQTHPQQVSNNNFTRRARIRKALIVEKIDRQAIIRRDNSICHICKKKVKPSQMSLDHLIPLSQGGPHTSLNLAVAHRICNGRRGAGRIPAQLRLY